MLKNKRILYIILAVIVLLGLGAVYYFFFYSPASPTTTTSTGGSTTILSSTGKPLGYLPYGATLKLDLFSNNTFLSLVKPDYPTVSQGDIGVQNPFKK